MPIDMLAMGGCDVPQKGRDPGAVSRITGAEELLLLPVLLLVWLAAIATFMGTPTSLASDSDAIIAACGCCCCEDCCCWIISASSMSPSSSSAASMYRPSWFLRSSCDCGVWEGQRGDGVDKQ